MLHHRRQWPVGQGFFHSGKVEADGAEAFANPPLVKPYLDYVYDCGAISFYSKARNREIKRFRHEMRDGVIDLLFLSHIHADHVNGLPKLLERRGKGPSVDTLVMPLVDDIERLIAFAVTVEMDPDSASDEFYRAFVLDAVGEIARRFSPRQIILVRAGRRGPDDGAPDLSSPSPTPDEVDSPFEDGPLDRFPFPTGRWKLIGRGIVRRSTVGSEVPDGTRTTRGSAGGAGSQFFEIDDTAAFFTRNSRGEAWLLAPFVDPGIRRSKKHFLNALAAALKTSPRNLAHMLRDKAQRQRLITEERAALRRAYKALATDLNLTSMALLSTPAFTRASAGEALVWSASHCTTRRWTEDGDGRVSWLGTGDASLRHDRRRRAFLRHYRNHLHAVHTLTVPHHGAEPSFHIDLVRKVQPTLCVVAADRFKDWRHPATSVVQAIASVGAEVKIATAAEISRIDELVCLSY